MKIVVSVIIVSHNTKELTAKCISSVEKSLGFKKEEIEIIVVDNNSSDGTVSYLKKSHPSIQIIQNDANLGFGSSNNQASKKAKGEYLLLLNTDAFLVPHSLRIMVDILAKRDDLIAVGPQLRYADDCLQPSAGYFPTPLRVFAWMFWLDKLPLVKHLFPRPYHIYDRHWYQQDQYPDWLMGACVLFRREQFLAVGGFDQKIFMYGEEVELFIRLKQKFAKKVLLTTKTKVTHLGSMSTKKAKASRLTQELKAIEYIYAKHYCIFSTFIRVVIFLGTCLRFVVFSLIPSRRDTLLEYQQYLGGNRAKN